MTKRSELASEVLSILGGGETLEGLGAKRIEAHDHGVVFLIEQDGFTQWAMTISKREGGFSLYAKRIPQPQHVRSFDGLTAGELRKLFRVLLKETPETV